MKHKVCPWWLGYLLINPLRRLIHNPNKILSLYIREGMTVLDVGPGMGYFTLTMTKLVGVTGKVVAVDLQPQMLEKLKARAAKANVLNRIITVLCSDNSLKLNEYNGQIDFALASAVVHEVPDTKGFLEQIFQALKPNGKLLVMEPSGHVSEEDFDNTAKLAKQVGFDVKESKDNVWWFRSALLIKKI